MCQVDISYSKPMIKEGKKSYGDYSSIVGLNGVCTLDDSKRKFKGCMVLSWTEESYLKSASAILMEEFSEYNDEISDVGMEICNITMGNAKKILSEMGYQVEMSIPTSVVGKTIRLELKIKLLLLEPLSIRSLVHFILSLATLTTRDNIPLGVFYHEGSLRRWRC